MVARLDIIIFGATGFTGRRCIPYMSKFATCNGHNFTWGIAGRSEEKLRRTLENVGNKIDANLWNIPITVSDIDDEDSLFEMAKKTRLVINCVGPYILYGEKVIDACLKAGTHHIDISGEPQFMEKMQLTKNDIAKEKGVYIISACGVDSIPSDLGIIQLAKNFKGVLNSVVTYLGIWAEGPRPELYFNFTTYATFVHNLSRITELTEIKKNIFREKVPTFEPKLKILTRPQRANAVEGWAIPFPGADRSVIKRTQKYFYEVLKKRPIQVDTLLVLKETRNVVLTTLIANIFLILSKFQCGKKLLLNHPEIFSWGMFGKKQPSEEIIENTWFQITFYGEGWKDISLAEIDGFSKPCNRKIVARIKGRNPGYGSTCVCVVAAAITVLSETENLPTDGGVYTPGVAFAETSLMKILHENGVTFEIISQQDILKSNL